MLLKPVLVSGVHVNKLCQYLRSHQLFNSFLIKQSFEEEILESFEEFIYVLECSGRKKLIPQRQIFLECCNEQNGLLLYLSLINSPISLDDCLTCRERGQ